MRAGARLAVVVSALGLAAASPLACGHLPRTGNISLRVLVGSSAASDAMLSVVQYKLTSHGLPTTTGRIQTAKPSNQFTKLISHVPVGDDYLVQVTGNTADGKVMCEGMARADVKRNATTQVNLTLTCRNAGDGQVSIVIGIQCPWFHIESFTVAPLSASVGSTIAVAATTTDTDGGATSYLWTAPVGGFASPTAAHTTYTCAKPGPTNLTIAVSTDPCQDSQTIPVSCIADGGAGDAPDDDAI